MVVESLVCRMVKF